MNDIFSGFDGIRSQSGSVIAERNFVRVFGTIVQVLPLGDLVDKEPDEDAGDDALVQRGANHVKHFIVDPVQLLQTLQVIFLRGGVSNRPESEVVHVAKEREVVAEGNAKSLLLQVAILIRELTLGNVVRVGDGFTEVLATRL